MAEWWLVTMACIPDNHRTSRLAYRIARHSQCARHLVRKRRCVVSARWVRLHVVGVENARGINMWRFMDVNSNDDRRVTDRLAQWIRNFVKVFRLCCLVFILSTERSLSGNMRLPWQTKGEYKQFYIAIDWILWQWHSLKGIFTYRKCLCHLFQRCKVNT